MAKMHLLLQSAFFTQLKLNNIYLSAMEVMNF